MREGPHAGRWLLGLALLACAVGEDCPFGSELERAQHFYTNITIQIDFDWPRHGALVVGKGDERPLALVCSFATLFLT
jgi:hypothetical protein